ncbi:hypothetical protein [Sphingomonas hankyongi]|uniref:TolA protein n=1 Tax=Sphingomonas hankyongi TaxID=2908209 RepID=A0ABT0RZD9_9SPHN|nr:hypothetical protein [Sphingomonas hankyongi]MCL6728972.1 hypothetical protein [Sphingomonas hankyongi]
MRSVHGLVVGAAAVLGALNGSAVHAQYSIAAPDPDAPHIMCKAYKVGTNDVWASGEAPNVRESYSRFEYYARKYDENLRSDCQRFTNIDPDYRKSFEPGETYQGSFGDTYTLIQAPFLPEDWSTTPTPEEKTKAQAEKKGRKGEAAKPATAEAASPEPKKSAAQIAAEEAAARKAKYEAEFQAKQDEYERQLAERERKIQEFNELTAKMEAQKQANLAAAAAAADAYKKEQDKYADVVRQHQDEVARYEAQVNGTAANPPAGKPGRFQVTGGIVDTRDAAMASLMRDPRGPQITDIRCDEITFYNPPKWSCFGFVIETRTPGQGSAQ